MDSTLILQNAEALAACEKAGADCLRARREFIQKTAPDVVPAARYPQLVVFSEAAEALPAFAAAPHGDSTYSAQQR